MIHRYSIVILSGLLSLRIASTSVHGEIYTFTFVLDGSQEVPPNASPATGQCIVTLDDVARTVDVDCTYADLTSPATAAHIHQGVPGENGPPFVTLNHSAATSGNVTGFAPLTLQQLQDILAGHTYINVHSSTFPGGEIRGQIVNPPQPEPIRFNGLLHAPLGQSQLIPIDVDGDLLPDVLVASNIGSSGNDGVRIDLFNMPGAGDGLPGLPPQGWSGEIDFGPAGNIPQGFELTVTARDQFGNPIPFFSASETNKGDAAITLAPACTNCTITVQAISNGAVIGDFDYDGSADVLATGPIGSSGDAGTTASFRVRTEIVGENATPFYSTQKGLRFAAPTTIQLSGAPSVLNDVDALSVRITAPSDGFDPIVELLSATGTTILGTTTDITIQNESLLLYAYDVQARKAGFMDGTVVCDDGPTPICLNALQISNLGSSGDDGVQLTSAQAPGSKTRGYWVTFDPVALENDFLLSVSGELEVAGTAGGTSPGVIRLDASASGAAAPTGPQVEFTADFTGGDFAIDQNVITIFLNGAPATSVGSLTFDGSSVLATARCEGCGNPWLGDIAAAPHAGGQHVPGIVWGFTQPVQIELPNDPTIYIGDELRLVSGQPAIVENDKGLLVTLRTPAGAPPGTLYITDIKPASIAFTEGYVFGLLLLAPDGSVLTVSDDGERDLIVSGPSDGGGGVTIQTGAADFLAVELGDERELTTGLDWGLRGTAHGQDAAGLMALYQFEFNVEDAGKGDPDPPVIIGVDFAPSGASLQTITVHHEDGTVTELRNMPNQTPITSVGATTDKAMPKLTQASTKGQGPKAGPEVGFGWHEPVEVSVDGIVIADAVRFVFVEAQAPTTILPLSQVHLQMQGGLTEFTIADVALGVFDLEHRAEGARYGCCADADGDGELDLVMFNPLATGGAATVSSKPRQIAVATLLSAAHTCEFIVPDPCAGKPKPCEVYPDGATLMSQATFQTTSGGSSQNSSCWIHFSQPAASDCPKGPIGPLCEVTLTSDFTELGSGAITVEVLDDEVVAATVPFINSVPSIRILNTGCPDCGHNENWPFETEWETGTARDGAYRVTARWVSGQNRSFAFEGGPTVEGDALRFTATSAVGDIEGIIEHQLTTINIPELHITDMEFVDGPQPTPCSPDIAPPGGDNVVNASDLLAVINGWGACSTPCPPSCMADTNQDCTVNATDLLAVINGWGQCPQ